MLIIAAHRFNRSPSQRFRFEQYINYLTAQNVQVKLSYIISKKDDVYFYSKGHFFRKLWILVKAYAKRWGDVFTCGKYDVIFVQREAIMTRTVLFEKMMAWRKPLIFDFDDAIWKMDISDANQNLKWLKNPAKTSKIIKRAAFVIAGNDYLEAYAKTFNQNTCVIPTTVDTDLFKPLDKPVSNCITIGWSGSKTTVKHFELLVDVLYNIKQKFGNTVCFKVIGDPEYKNEKLGVTGIAWNELTETADLNTFDIGIMPLPDDEWAKGKCGLKGLTYMALEIPTIMSNVGVNTQIIEHGKNGFLAQHFSDFENLLSTLVQNATLRKTMGAQGRKTVLERYSVEVNKQKYLHAIQHVVTHTKSTKKRNNIALDNKY